MKQKLLIDFNCPKDKKKPAATYFPGTDPVSSAQGSLTSVFGMGTGISSPPWPPALMFLMPSRHPPAGATPRGRAPQSIGKRTLSDSPSGGSGNMAKPRGLLVMLG